MTFYGEEKAMEIRKVKLVYFSPTGTTRKILENVAGGVAVKDVEHIDLTLPGTGSSRMRCWS